MSNEFLATLQITWNSLPPDLQDIVTSTASKLAATLSANVIGGLSRALRRQIVGTPAEQALEDVFADGLRACMAALTPPDAWREERYCAAMAYFLSLEEVADEFAALVDVRPDVELDVKGLQELFEANGRELALLPGLNFEAAVHAFALTYCDAVERSGIQQHVDQLRHLKQVVIRLEEVRRETALSREELVRIREAVQEVQGALERGLADQARVFYEAVAIYRSFPEDTTATVLQELASRVAELSEAILGTVRQDAEAFRRADLETKEAAYRILIASEFERLDFRGMLQHGQPVTLPLERVYVSLRATRRVPAADTPQMDRLRRRLEEDDARRAEGQLSFLNDERREELERRLEELERARWQKEAETVDLNAALADRDNLGMVVLGDPGAGKTTLLKYLALVFARDAAPAKLKLDEQRLPIFLPLAFYDAALTEKPDLPLGDYLASYYASEKNLPGLKPVFGSALREGRAIVLLDGLDEVLEAETRSRVGRRAEAFMRQETGRGNRVLLTSRIVGYRGVELPADIPHLTILDMDIAAVHAFVERWALALICQVRGEPFETPTVKAQQEAAEMAQGLKRAIEDAESVRCLAVNPLLLTILAVVYTQEGMALPRRRVELYDRYARILIETWRRARTSGRFVGKEMEFLRTSKVLGPLALWLQEEWPSGTAPGPRLRERLTGIFLERLGWKPGQRPDDEQGIQAHRQAKDFLADVREFAGVLVERGRDTYGFLHLTFQEYFAAWWLAKMDHVELLACLGAHLHDPRWREVILLTAGQLGVIEGNERQVSGFVDAILNARSLVPELYRDLLLAAACLADDVGVRPDLSQVIVSRLAALLESSVPALARTASESLGGLAETSLAAQALDVALITLHGEAEWWNHQVAIGCLGRLGQTSLEVIESFIGALGSNDWRVRQAAAGALAQLGQTSPEVMEALIAALADRAWPVREAAVASLIQLGQASSEIMEALIAALGDNDSGIREAAVVSLNQLGQASPEVIEALIAALGDSDWNVRRVAAHSLGQLGQTSLGVIDSLITTLGDDVLDVCQAAAGSLVQLGQVSPEVVEALITALLGHGDQDVRQAAAGSLGQLGQISPEVVQALVTALSDSDRDVCQAAAGSLVQLDQASPEISDALISTLLGDSDWYVRRVAARSLGQLGQVSPEVIEALITVLSDSDWDVRRIAAGSLVQLGQTSPQVIERFIAALRDSDRGVRQAAASSLSQFGQTSYKVIEELITALSDDDRDVRQGAASSLLQLGQEAASSLVQLDQTSPEVICELIAALGHDDRDVRQAAAGSLGQPGQASREVIEGLVAALSDSDWHVRQAAAGSLGQLGQASREIIEGLVAALSDSDWHVRQAAAGSLGQLGQASPAVIETLIVALADTDYDVRDAAYHALLALAPKEAGWVQSK